MFHLLTRRAIKTRIHERFIFFYIATNYATSYLLHARFDVGNRHPRVIFFRDFFRAAVTTHFPEDVICQGGYRREVKRRRDRKFNLELFFNLRFHLLAA